MFYVREKRVLARDLQGLDLRGMRRSTIAYFVPAPALILRARCKTVGR